MFTNAHLDFVISFYLHEVRGEDANCEGWDEETGGEREDRRDPLHLLSSCLLCKFALSQYCRQMSAVSRDGLSWTGSLGTSGGNIDPLERFREQGICLTGHGSQNSSS